MENKKNGKGMVIAVVILFLLVLGLGGFIVYDKIYSKSSSEINKNDKISTNEDLEKNILDSNSKISVFNKNFIQSLSFDFGEVLVDKDGNVYITFNNQDIYGRDLKQQYGDSLQKLKNMYNKYKIKEYHTNPCDGEAELYEGIKINLEKIISAYYMIQGHADRYLIFIKEDGTLSALDVEKTLSSGTIILKEKIDNLQNIVSVVQSGTVTGCSESNEITALEADGTSHIINKIS